MYVGTYTVKAEGYAQTTLTVAKDSTELAITLKESITIGKGATKLTNKAWNDQEKLAIPEGLTDGDFVFEATLKMRDFTHGWDDYAAYQRYAIRLTKGNVGFYFWSWDNGGYRTFVRQFGENNLTDATAENTPVNGDETNNGYILTALLSEDGLQLRILRGGNTFFLYAKNGENWVKVGSVSCAEGDTIDMELYAGVGTYEWSNVNFTEVTYVDEKAPVVGGADGNVAYYTDGTNYWLEDGTVTTAEDVVLSAVEVKLTVAGLALDGKTEATIAEGTVITLTGAYGNYTFKMGEAAPTQMLAATYTVTAEGYAQTTLVVPKEGGDLTLTLKAAKSIAGTVDDYKGNRWSDSFTLDISEELKKSTAVILEFNVRNVTNSQASGNEEWASQRIAIQMAKGYEGFLFFLPKGEANVFDMTDNGIADSGKTRFGGSGTALSWIDTLMRGVGGVNMRIVRTGANVTLFVQNEKAEWVKIGTVACADAETEIIFYGCGVEWAFSSITVKEIEYVAEKQPVAGGADGNVAYYTDGTNYWLADGNVTTAEDVVVPAEPAEPEAPEEQA